MWGRRGDDGLSVRRSLAGIGSVSVISNQERGGEGGERQRRQSRSALVDAGGGNLLGLAWYGWSEHWRTLGGAVGWVIGGGGVVRGRCGDDGLSEKDRARETGDTICFKS